MKLCYEGPICLDIPDSPPAWTVIDKTSPYYKMTLCRDEMLKLGFTEKDLQDAVNSSVKLDATLVNS